MTEHPMVVEKCPACGAAALSWSIVKVNASSAADGCLKMHDVQVHAMLGCDKCSETVRVVDADSELARLHGEVGRHVHTADGVRMYLGMQVFVVRAIARFDECSNYGVAEPLGDDAIVEAEVCWLGTLGSDRQRAGFIQTYASGAFNAEASSVFGTREAALSKGADDGR